MKLHPTVDRVAVTGNEKNKNETITAKLGNEETKVEVLKSISYRTENVSNSESKLQYIINIYIYIS